MMNAAIELQSVTQAWASSAGGQTMVRGRRRDSAGPVLHFVHGNSFCCAAYWPMLRGLVPDYGLFWQDLEGHGDSDVPARFAGTQKLVDRIAAVIAEQKPGGSALIGVGHSYGGALTLRVATDYPELFSALVLLDPILLPHREWLASRTLGLFNALPLARTAQRRRSRWPDLASVRQHLRGRGIYRGWNEEAFEGFLEHGTRDEHGERVLSCPPWMEAKIFSTPIYPWAALRKLRCPVLLIHGLQSYPFMAPSVQRAAALCPTLELQSQPGGHLFMLEDPATTAATIRQFLSRHGF